MTSALLSGLEGAQNVDKALKAYELGLVWGATLFPKTNDWKSMIQWVRSYSEPFVVGSCARAGYKWLSGVRDFCSHPASSLKKNVAKYASLSAGLLEKMFKVSSWMHRTKIMQICDHIVPRIAFGASLAEATSSLLDVGLLSHEQQKDWMKIAQKSLDLTAAILVIAVMAETGLPVQEVILLCKTASFGVTLSEGAAWLYQYASSSLKYLQEKMSCPKKLDDEDDDLSQICTIN